MKTSEDNSGNDTRSGTTFPKEIHEKDLPNVKKVNLSSIDPVERYNVVKKLDARN